MAQSCSNILLDVNLTKCGQLVILHEQTLHRVECGPTNGLTAAADKQMPAATCINAMAMDELSSINLAKNHPLWWVELSAFFARAICRNQYYNLSFSVFIGNARAHAARKPNAKR